MRLVDPTVFVVDDDRGARKSLALLLRSVDLRTETFASAGEFLEVHDAERPGCLVLDVRMPGMSGLELQERLREMGSTLPIIFVTAHGDVPMAVHAVKAGAVDFIQKPFRDEELLEMVRRALAENARRRQLQADREEVAERIASLTQRELEVMIMVTEGKANKVIALELGLSQRTVEAHRANVMKKMRAHSAAELVQMRIFAEGQPWRPRPAGGPTNPVSNNRVSAKYNCGYRPTSDSGSIVPD